MSRKQAIILLILGIFLAFLLVKPYNYLCKITGWCSGINVSYYIPTYKGEKYFDVIFEAKDSSMVIDFQALTDRIVLKTGKNIAVKYKIRNLSDKKIVAAPKRYIYPQEALKYIEFYECLCFKTYKIAAKDEEIIEIRFKIDPKIENDPLFQDKMFIRIGYEVKDNM